MLRCVLRNCHGDSWFIGSCKEAPKLLTHICGRLSLQIGQLVARVHARESSDLVAGTMQRVTQAGVADLSIYRPTAIWSSCRLPPL